MFQPWRIKVREAEQAFRNGQLEEAGALLSERGLLEFLPAKQLMAQVAAEMTHRAQQRFAAGATMAGWQDLESAQRLGAERLAVEKVKQEFIDRGLSEAEEYLKAGEPAAALARLETLAKQGATGRNFRVFHEAAVKVSAAQQHCFQGRFAQADEELAQALVLRPGWRILEEIRQACGRRAAAVRKQGEQLRQAIADENWAMAVEQADAILELCPEHAVALDARRRGWDAIGMRVDTSSVCRISGPSLTTTADAKLTPTPSHDADAEQSLSAAAESRFVLWVDGVGGYLVCQRDVISIGQPVQGDYVDVPVLGDISRLHAKIHRQGESYMLEPLRPTRIDGQTIDRMTLLVDGNQIELGDGVRLRFRIPNPLSRTARLDFVSRHRTWPSTDGVVLMAEACLLGPARSAHIHCRDWAQEVMLYSDGAQLNCRAVGQYFVDGTPVEGRAAVSRSSQVVGDEFSFSLEQI